MVMRDEKYDSRRIIRRNRVLYRSGAVRHAFMAAEVRRRMVRAHLTSRAPGKPVCACAPARVCGACVRVRGNAPVGGCPSAGGCVGRGGNRCGRTGCAETGDNAGRKTCAAAAHARSRETCSHGRTRLCGVRFVVRARSRVFAGRLVTRGPMLLRAARRCWFLVRARVCVCVIASVSVCVCRVC